MRGPFEDALTAAAAARVDGLMQRRLVLAVSAPAGSSTSRTDRCSSGSRPPAASCFGGQPAGAPMALVSLLGDRLTGVLACAVLATVPLVARPRDCS